MSQLVKNWVSTLYDLLLGTETETQTVMQPLVLKIVNADLRLFQRTKT
jgi:hypothetical protein